MAEPYQIMGLENDRTSAVLPDALQGELEPAVGAFLETVVRSGRARTVATEPLGRVAVYRV